MITNVAVNIYRAGSMERIGRSVTPNLMSQHGAMQENIVRFSSEVIWNLEN